MSHFGHCANSCIRRILDEVTTAAGNLGREKEVNGFIADAKEFITSYVAQVFAAAGSLSAYHSAFFNTMLDVNATSPEITDRLNELLKKSSTEIPRFLILLHLNDRHLARKAAEDVYYVGVYASQADNSQSEQKNAVVTAYKAFFDHSLVTLDNSSKKDLAAFLEPCKARQSADNSRALPNQVIREYQTEHSVSKQNGENLSNFPLLNILGMVVGLVDKIRWQSKFANDAEKNSDVFNYGKLLLCFLVASDQRLSDQETNLVNTFWREAGGSELTPQDVYDLVVACQEEALNALREAPSFFRLLVEHDIQHSTNYAEGAWRFLRVFVEIIVGVDNEVTDREADVAASVLWTLQTYAHSQGLNLSTKEETTKAAVREPDAPEITSTESVPEILKELGALIGLAEVKEEVTGLANLIKVRKLRQNRGIKCPPLSLHLVFSGNPGTGKTTVARLLSGILKRLGILSKGHLVEIDRSGLVGGYIGQTAIKVKEVTDKAMGGVLFIDEAYSLASKCEWDFGREAVETLLKTMEDHRDDLVIIAAGYTEKMQEFLDINPGLRSRFNKFIHFQDYSPEELFQIFSKICADSGYEFTPEFSETMREILTVEYNSRGKDFANARAARNLFERVVANHSNRLAGNSAPSDEELVTFRVDDINALAKRDVQKMEKRLV